MKCIKVHFSPYDTRDGYWNSVEIEIPGLGKLEMKDCLSNETMDAVCREVEASARIKLKIKEIDAFREGSK